MTKLLTGKEWEAVHGAVLSLLDDPEWWSDRPDMREAAMRAAKKLPDLLNTASRAFYTPRFRRRPPRGAQEDRRRPDHHQRPVRHAARVPRRARGT